MKVLTAPDVEGTEELEGLPVGIEVVVGFEDPVGCMRSSGQGVRI